MLVRMTEDTVHWECCREAGLRRAEQFSWKRCANLTRCSLSSCRGGLNAGTALLHKTYLSETVGGIEQVIFQLC